MTQRTGQKGQALVFFVVVLTGLLAMSALMLDSGIAWVNRRQAQNAADMAALAAGRAASVAGMTCTPAGTAVALAAATQAAQANGFSSATIAFPPASGRFAGDCGYVQVTVGRTVGTTFARVMGQESWAVDATAVATVPQAIISGPGECQICALRTSNAKHTFVVEGAADITLDGSIYVNGNNVEKEDCWKNGQALYVSWASGANGTGACGSPPNPEVRILAETVRVVGGWRTDKGSIIQARRPAGPTDSPPSTCSSRPQDRPDLPGYTEYSPPIVGNLCMNQPVLADPLAALPAPNLAAYPVRHGSASSPTQLVLIAGTTTLEPGIYYGGIKITETATAVLKPGEYILAGKGLIMDKAASLQANNVFIFNTSSDNTGKSGPITIRTTGSIHLGPLNNGAYAGITIFQDRRSAEPVTFDPNNATQCATKKGCIGDISGTIYAAHNEAEVFFKASGETDLRVVAGLVRLGKATKAVFHWPGGGGSSVIIPPPSLVE